MSSHCAAQVQLPPFLPLAVLEVSSVTWSVAQCEKTPPGHSLGRIVAGWRHVAALAVPTRLPSMPFLLTMPPRG